VILGNSVTKLSRKSIQWPAKKLQKAAIFAKGCKRLQMAK